MAGLSCQDGECKCAESSYWKNTKCGNWNFSHLNKLKNKFYNFLFKGLLSLFKQNCSGNEECHQAKNLTCSEGKCECKDSGHYWSEKSSSCGN